MDHPLYLFLLRLGRKCYNTSSHIIGKTVENIKYLAALKLSTVYGSSNMGVPGFTPLPHSPLRDGMNVEQSNTDQAIQATTTRSHMVKIGGCHSLHKSNRPHVQRASALAKLVYVFSILSILRHTVDKLIQYIK